MISKAAGFHTNHTKARLHFSHSSEVMPETDCTVKSHCYMGEEMDWLQTIKQSQDREKCVWKLSAELFRAKCVLLLGGCKPWSKANWAMGTVIGCQCDATRVQYTLFTEDIACLPYPTKHWISVEQSQKECRCLPPDEFLCRMTCVSLLNPLFSLFFSA